MFIQNILYSSHLERKEKIYYVAHVHPFTMQKSLFKILLFLILVPVGLAFLFPQLWGIWAFWIGIGLLKTLYELVDWYYDAWLVTNKSVIAIEWNGIFNRNSTRIEYYTIEGVSYEIKGFWGTIFNFGDVVIEKISSRKPIILKNSWNPKRIESKVLKYQEKMVNDQSFKQHSKLKDLLGQMIQSHETRKK